MKKILEQFPPPEESLSKIYPSVPQKVFDLHGYTAVEIPAKVEWIIGYSYEKYFDRIRIVTGVGKGILFAVVKKELQKAKEKSKISHFTLSSGVIEVYL